MVRDRVERPSQHGFLSATKQLIYGLVRPASTEVGPEEPNGAARDKLLVQKWETDFNAAFNSGFMDEFLNKWQYEMSNMSPLAVISVHDYMLQTEPSPNADVALALAAKRLLDIHGSKLAAAGDNGEEDHTFPRELVAQYFKSYERLRARCSGKPTLCDAFPKHYPNLEARVDPSSIEWNQTKLGEGRFTVVYEGIFVDGPVARKVALKTLRPNFSVRQSHLWDEARAYTSVGKHPNIVEFFGIVPRTGELRMSLVLAHAQVNLRQFLDRMAEPFKVIQSYAASLDVVRGLAHLHRRCISHRSLNPDTILVLSDGRLQLGDLSNARNRDSTRTSARYSRGPRCNHIVWVAPELHQYYGVDLKPINWFAFDVYALAMTLYIFLESKLPWADQMNSDVLKFSRSDKQRPAISNNHLTVLVGVVRRGWKCKANERYSLADDVVTESLEDELDKRRRGSHVSLTLRQPPTTMSVTRSVATSIVPERFGPNLQIKGTIIESGAFGTVYFGLLDGDKVAVKKPHFPESDAGEHVITQFMNEINIHKILGKSKANIVSFLHYHVDTSVESLALVLEYCENGDLHKYIEKVPRIKPLPALELALNIARGVAYCHSRGIFPRDICPRNILLDKDDRPKLCDFGLGVYKDSPSIIVNCGSKPYQAPETFGKSITVHKRFVQNREWLARADVYSFAATIYAVVEKREPWERFQPESIEFRALKGERPQIRARTRARHPTLVQYIERCWAAKPSDRPRLYNFDSQEYELTVELRDDFKKAEKAQRRQDEDA